MLQNRRRHLPPPWASLRSRARLDLRLVMPPRRAQSVPCASSTAWRLRIPIPSASVPLVARQHDVCGLVQKCADPPVAALRDAAGIVDLAWLVLAETRPDSRCWLFVPAEPVIHSQAAISFSNERIQGG